MTTLACIYALAAIIYVWLLVDVYFKGSYWRVKAVLIVAAPSLCFALWAYTRPLTGWPTPTNLPPKAAFDWGIIEEPDPQTGNPGAIFLWLTDPGTVTPRAYKLPYSRPLHKQVQAALNMQKKGIPVQGKTIQATGGQRRRQVRSRYVFYPEPPRILPSKQSQISP